MPTWYAILPLRASAIFRQSRNLPERSADSSPFIWETFRDWIGLDRVGWGFVDVSFSIVWENFSLGCFQCFKCIFLMLVLKKMREILIREMPVLVDWIFPRRSLNIVHLSRLHSLH